MLPSQVQNRGMKRTHHWQKLDGRFRRLFAPVADVFRCLLEGKDTTKELLRFALDSSQTGVWELNLTDQVIVQSFQFDCIFGYDQPLPRWTYRMLLDHVVAEDRAAVEKEFDRARVARSDWTIECRIQRKDGVVRWIWVAGRHRADVDDRMAGIVQDITERKQALVQQARIEAELAEVRLLQSISSEIIQEQHVEGLYEKLMEAAIAIMGSHFASMQMLHPDRGDGGELELLAFRGFTPEAATFWKWVGIDSGGTCGAALRSRKRVVVSDVESCESMVGTEDREVYRQTGIRACQTTPLFSRNGSIVGMISTHWREPHEPSERNLRLLDIVARQAADFIERKRTQATFFDLIGRAPFGIYVVDGDFHISEVNAAALPMFAGIPGLMGRDFGEVMRMLWPPAYAEEIIERFRHTLETGESYETPERIERRRDRKVLECYEWRIDRLPLSDGRQGVVCYFRDISNQIKARTAIAESEERYRSLVSIITDVPWVADADGAFTTRQPAWQKYTGQSWEEYREFGWVNALHEDDRTSVLEIWKCACANHELFEANGRLWHAATRQYRHFLARATPLFNRDKTVREWVGTCLDVHEKRLAVDALRDAQRKLVRHAAELQQRVKEDPPLIK
jgi:PAS domain S-box-containing protein